MRSFIWDPEKARQNLASHGYSFEDAMRFDFSNMLDEIDDRFDYGEERIVGTGFLDGTICVLVFTETETEGENDTDLGPVSVPVLVTRVISLRKATRIEADRYVKYFS